MSPKALTVLVVLPALCAADRYHASEPQMGSLASITLYADSLEQAEVAFQAAFSRIAELDAILSDYRVESELSRACTAAGPLSPDLMAVLVYAQSLAYRTSGAFDITAGAVTRIWRRARFEKRPPAAHEIAAALHRSGYQKVRLQVRSRQVDCLVDGLQFDAGGIAKGYAADQALAELRRLGIGSALVAMSGDIVAGDAPPGRPGWRIASLGETLLLSNAAVSTSGDDFQVLQIAGDRYSHIVDPRSGLPLRNSSRVRVIATNGMEADSLATAVSVGGAALAERLRLSPRIQITIE
jgi:thiamine biosynthesis lipoprotein